MTAPSDTRGLHPLDSGYVYAVRQQGPRTKRTWFKTKGEAVNRAEWLHDQGISAVAVRYQIRDEEAI